MTKNLWIRYIGFSFCIFIALLLTTLFITYVVKNELFKNIFYSKEEHERRQLLNIVTEHRRIVDSLEQRLDSLMLINIALNKVILDYSDSLKIIESELNNVQALSRIQANRMFRNLNSIEVLELEIYFRRIIAERKNRIASAKDNEFNYYPYLKEGK